MENPDDEETRYFLLLALTACAVIACTIIAVNYFDKIN